MLFRSIRRPPRSTQRTTLPYTTLFRSPLLEKVADAGLPVIFSTGGLQIANVDDLVSFFTHRGNDFAIMHCVSLYPIPAQHFHLSQIDALRNRYPGRVIGWSTHEAPDDVVPVQIAAAKGARIFERHVGIATDTAVETTLPTAHLDDIEAIAAMMLRSAISVEEVLAKSEAEN